MWAECNAIIKLSPELAAHLEAIKTGSRIVFEATRSFFAAISSRPEPAEGLNASGFVVDEVHRFNSTRSEDLFNAIRWSGKSRRNPLFVTISTAGVFDVTSTGWKQYKIASDIIKGINTQTDILPVIYELQPEDDWHLTNPDCEEVWQRANPSLGVTQDIDDFRHDVEAVEQNPSQLSAFLRYNFNLWQSSSSAWVTDDRWQTCRGDANLSDEQIRKITWTAALDLSSTIDLTSLVLQGRDEKNCKTYIKPFYWCSEDMASLRQRRDQVSYETWSRKSKSWTVPPIRTNEGEVIDFNKVRRDVVEICEKYAITKLAIDRWSANATAQQLQDDGLPVVFYGQGFKDMNPPLRELERLIFSKELVHDCPVLRWMVSNVEIVTDDAGNVKCSKKRSREKIDGVVALCMAIGVGMEPEQKSVYESRDIFII